MDLGDETSGKIRHAQAAAFEASMRQDSELEETAIAPSQLDANHRAVGTVDDVRPRERDGFGGRGHHRAGLGCPPSHTVPSCRLRPPLDMSAILFAVVRGTCTCT